MSQFITFVNAEPKKKQEHTKEESSEEEGSSEEEEYSEEEEEEESSGEEGSSEEEEEEEIITMDNPAVITMGYLQKKLNENAKVYIKEYNNRNDTECKELTIENISIAKYLLKNTKRKWQDSAIGLGWWLYKVVYPKKTEIYPVPNIKRTRKENSPKQNLEGLIKNGKEKVKIKWLTENDED